MVSFFSSEVCVVLFSNFDLSIKKSMDATASRPPNRRYSKLHFILESTFITKKGPESQQGVQGLGLHRIPISLTPDSLGIKCLYN